MQQVKFLDLTVYCGAPDDIQDVRWVYIYTYVSEEEFPCDRLSLELAEEHISQAWSRIIVPHWIVSQIQESSVCMLWCSERLQADISHVLRDLPLPCLSLAFEQDEGNILWHYWADKYRVPEMLANALPHLRYLELFIRDGPLDHTCWQIKRPQTDDGLGRAAAERIPNSKMERLRERLHAMDYDSLFQLKPEDVNVD